MHRCIIIHHTTKANYIPFKHLACSSFSLNIKYNCRDEIDKNTYLMKNSSRNQLRRCNVPPNHRPVCSLISQQHYHPRAGHDSPRKRKLRRLTHNQYMSKISQAKAMFGFIKLPRGWKDLFSKLVSSTI